ncbi:DUF6924 domain-containing protein [Georgenia daeguensis]|uniref:DUF6924 domain-containing protein n=1 Tax=Georgenia daeguensis TaxID=908355 RepID=A0ABP8ERM3_9MICO
MRLPEPSDLCLLLVRTDYSDQQAWRAALAAATAVYEVGDFPRMGACLEPVESPDLAGLTPHDLVHLPRAGYVGQLAVADAQTMRDQTVLFIDLNTYNDQVGRTFRAIPQQVEGIASNLTIANMDFFEYADAADPDGVFRGF